MAQVYFKQYLITFKILSFKIIEKRYALVIAHDFILSLERRDRRTFMLVVAFFFGKSVVLHLRLN